MKRYILIFLVVIAAILPFFIFKNRCPDSKEPAQVRKAQACRIDLKACQESMLKYLKSRKDKLAAVEMEKILSLKKNDTCALWVKAEILRRAYRFEESQELLSRVLVDCPGHAPSLVSLAYIKYRYNEFRDALKLLNTALKSPDLDRENLALAYLIIGSINAKRASQGGILSKVAYGTRVRGFFEKAKSIAPDISEVRLGLGTFYLLAPKIAGGDIDEAVKELEYAVKLTPDFASANVRLAQAYKQKGELDKYNYYLNKVRELEPENELLQEMEK